MEDVVIVAAARTPIGTFGGAFKSVSAVELGTVAAKAVYEQAGVSPEETDEVIIGSVLNAGLGQNVARQVALGAGCPYTVPAMTLDKVCGSSLRAITLAAQIIRAGDAEIILAGGTENMSRAPYLQKSARWGARMGPSELSDYMVDDGLTDVFNDYHMGVTAENVAEQWQLSREEQDAFAAESQKKAREAMESGRFESEIVPVEVTDRKGRVTVIDRDEHPRPETTLESLRSLHPAFKKEGTVTAGNASGINDGAAMVLVLSRSRAAAMGLSPIATITSFASGGVDPSVMGVAPISAVQSALEKAKFSKADVDLWEINEAFASQSIAVARELAIPHKRLNVNGGAIALGHPIGASGARIVVTLLHEMVRRKSGFGVAALCIGGGQSDAVLFSR